MRTDDLIKAIAGDAAAPQPATGIHIALALAVGGTISAALFVAILGVRPDIWSAAHTWRFLLKFSIMLVAFGCTLWASTRLMQPGTTLREVAPALAAAPLLLVMGILIELAMVPSGEWSVRAIGRYSRICLESIPLLSIAPVVAVLIVLRAGAPRSPSIAGAVAGGLGAALAATLYATHCPDDSPLFVASWYVLGMLPAIVAGAFAGRFTLRW